MKEIRGGIDFDSEGNMIGRLGRAKDYLFETNPIDGRSAFGDDVRNFGTKLKEKALTPFRKKEEVEGGKRNRKIKSKSKKSKKGSRKNKTRRR